MRFKSLTGKLVFVGIIALAFTTFYVSAEFMFTEHIRGEATRINMAGNLRFRSLRIAWLLHRMVENKRPELKETVMDEIKAFENIAGTLRSGRKDIGVRPVADRDEMKGLDSILNNWNSQIKPLVLNVLEHPDDKATATHDRYDSLINGYVSEINGFVGVLEEHFKDRIRRFNIFRACALVLFVIVSSSIALYIRKGIIKPVKSLSDAAKEIGMGNFDARIDVKGDDDIGLLAGTMNEMAFEIKEAVTNMEALVQWRTEELEAANEEMASSNEELQASYSQLEVTTAELEEVNQKFAEANDELKGLERLKTNFLHTISHELRSPLSPILGYLEVMKNGGVGELTSKQKEVVEEMHLCGRNMQLLIDELLEVASIQAGNILLDFKEVDLYQILLHAVKDVRKYAEEISTEIEIRVPEDTVLLVGDRKSLSEIFTHLLRNAVKFSRGKGKVEVEVKVKDNGVEVTVSDMGIGIPKDRFDKIFDVFYQVDSSWARRYEGVGLGLYLVKKLTDLHNGSIRVESKEGEGTTFRVFIPKGLNGGTGVETQNVASLPSATEVSNA